MNDKIYQLIVSNRNDEEEGKNGIVYVHANHLFEYKKQYNYLSFTCDMWKKNYFLPLCHSNNNKNLSQLNSLDLVEENFGINIEHMLRSENLSLYGFLSKNYTIMNEQDVRNNTFIIKTSEFLHSMLLFPITNSIKILTWVHNANYISQTNNRLLLTKFYLENI